MNTFSVPADRTDELPAACIETRSAGVSCGAAPQQGVGAGRLSHSADLEALAQQAERDGDPTGAAIYRRRAAYLNDLDAAEAIGGCFFDAMGQAQAKRERD